MTNYNIVRRAYSNHTVVETVSGWLAAELRAMELQAANADGEYIARVEGAPLNPPANPIVQSGFDFL